MSFIRPAVVLFILLTLLTGGVYPLLTTALGQWWFPQQANGSLVRIDGEVRGSRLIGQNFTAPGYFQGRPSATAEMPDNPLASGGSNLAASNPALDKAISERVQGLARRQSGRQRNGSGGAGDRLGERTGLQSDACRRSVAGAARRQSAPA